MIVPFRSNVFNGDLPMAKKGPKKLREVFYNALRDSYFSEKKILGLFRKMEKAASSADLMNAFKRHGVETRRRIRRLEHVFRMVERKPASRKCPAILGLVEQSEKIIKEYKSSPALDAALIGAGRAIVNYEASRYITVKGWARELMLNEAVELFQRTIEEQVGADEALNRLAINTIIYKAAA
jgi:ferritin-like metal-binding protein YciE